MNPQSLADLLLPCPFCGSPATLWGELRSIYPHVVCDSEACKACGPALYSVEAAITAWNTRQAAAEVRGGGWRAIDGQFGHEVSRSGAIRRVAILPQNITAKGYRKVAIAGKVLSVARIVATAFIPNEHDLPEVNHKDGNKGNNAADNLEWCTRSENMLHAYATGLHPCVSLSGPDNPNWGRKGALHNQSVAVRAKFPDGSHKDYESQAATADDGFKPNKVSECITGKRKSHGGATWQPLPSPPGAVGEGEPDGSR